MAAQVMAATAVVVPAVAVVHRGRTLYAKGFGIRHQAIALPHREGDSFTFLLSDENPSPATVSKATQWSLGLHQTYDPHGKGLMHGNAGRSQRPDVEECRPELTHGKDIRIHRRTAAA
jgi:hypothetical protein